MPIIRVSRKINSKVEAVFKAVTDIENLPSTNPDVLKTEFLSEQKSGVGTRFREVRLNNGKEMVFDLEVLEFETNERIRMTNDTHGTTWDTTITFKQDGQNQTDLEMAMEARAFQWLPKLLNPLLKGLYKKGMEKHVSAIKNYCEGNS